MRRGGVADGVGANAFVGKRWARGHGLANIFPDEAMNTVTGNSLPVTVYEDRLVRRTVAGERK